MAEPVHSAPKHRGRPRSEVSHQAVLDAAVTLLAEQGMDYHQLSVEGIAAQAGVSKQTIYRWWPNKAAVVLEVLLTGRLPMSSAEVPHTHDLRADLRHWLQAAFCEQMGEGTFSGARSLVAALATASPDTRALIPEGAGLWDLTSVGLRLRAAADDRQLGEGVNPSQVASALMDPLVMRLVISDQLELDWAMELVDTVLDGALGPKQA